MESAKNEFLESAMQETELDWAGQERALALVIGSYYRYTLFRGSLDTF